MFRLVENPGHNDWISLKLQGEVATAWRWARASR